MEAELRTPSQGAGGVAGCQQRERRRPTPQELDALGDEIAQLAGQIAAATARFLKLLGEFDAHGGWGGVGIRSVAHWLSWRAGMSLRTAREHVRVARALRELPLTEEAFGRGELSFSKVRALSRVATPGNEDSLVDLARNAPAAHVERLVAGLRKVAREDPLDDDAGAWRKGCPGDGGNDEGGTGGEGTPGAGPRSSRGSRPPAPPAQSLHWRWDKDTDELVVWGRFGAADGRLLLAALTRAELERVRTMVHEAGEEPASAGADVSPGTSTEEQSGPAVPGVSGAPDEGHPDESQPDESQLDDGTDGAERPEAVDRTAPPPHDAGPAFVALAQIGLTVQEAPAYAPAAEVIYIHQRSVAGDGSAEHHQEPSHGGVVSADDGPALDAGTGEEVMCRARARCVVKGAGGAVLAYGRSRRMFSATQLRALRLRDRCCQTPGCQRTRFLHAHHVVFWSATGATDMDNAVLLCSGCHRAVHLGRLRIRSLGGQRFEFADAAGGRVLQEAPPLFGQADQILADRTITPRTVTGGWEGEPLDLSLVTSELLFQWRRRTNSPPRRPYDDLTPWEDPGRGRWHPGDAA